MTIAFKRCLLLFILLYLAKPEGLIAQVCNPEGNVVIFSNYDGSKETTAGRLNINVDANIPNLKIGICSYERVTVNITGTYKANVTKVIYAGYNGTTNCNCYYPLQPSGCHATTVVTGVASGIISYLIMPPATFGDPNGYGDIICAYQCAGGGQGGCNTPEQVVDYFISAFGPGSVFRSHEIQYSCWDGVTKSLSLGGNCCRGSLLLPVELLSFQARCLPAGNRLLEWSTASETNNDYFTLERSANGIDFEMLGTMKGAGSSTTLKTYSWTDNTFATGINYYRLKQTDFDGKYVYSNVISAKADCGGNEVSISSVNPTAGGDLTFRLNNSDEHCIAAVYDVIGRVVMSAALPATGNDHSYLLHADALTGGIYFLSVKTAGGEAQQKFILQKE